MVRGRAPTPEGFALFSALRVASSDAILLIVGQKLSHSIFGQYYEFGDAL